MNLGHLRTFVVVADELHFGRAALRLHMAQPAVSQQIKILEKDLGVQLFERSTRSVTLTPRGRAFYEPAKTVLEDVEVATRAARYGRARTSGRVSIGFSSMSSHRTLAMLAGELERREPGIALSLLGLSYGGSMIRELVAGNLDIGITRLPLPERELDWHVFAHESLIVAMPEDHELATRSEIAITDLADERLITFPATSGSTVREATLRLSSTAGFAFASIQEAPDTYSILGMAAAGFGLAVTVSSVQNAVVPGLCFRPLAGAVPMMTVAFAWRRHSPSPALQAFVEIVKDVLPTPAPPLGEVFGEAQPARETRSEASIPSK